MKQILTFLILILFTISSCKKANTSYLQGVWSLTKVTPDGQASEEVGADNVHYFVFKDMKENFSDEGGQTGIFYHRLDIYSFNPTDTVISYSHEFDFVISKSYTTNDLRISFEFPFFFNKEKAGVGSYNGSEITVLTFDVVDLSNDNLIIKGAVDDDVFELKKVYSI